MFVPTFFFPVYTSFMKNVSYFIKPAKYFPKCFDNEYYKLLEVNN